MMKIRLTINNSNFYDVKKIYKELPYNNFEVYLDGPNGTADSNFRDFDNTINEIIKYHSNHLIKFTKLLFKDTCCKITRNLRRKNSRA